MTKQEIMDNKPTKKVTHYAVDNDGKLIYLRQNKNYGWDYWSHKWIYAGTWFKNIKPL